MIEERIEKVLSSTSSVTPVICHGGPGPGLGKSCSLPSISWLDSAQWSFIISSFPLLAQGRHHRTLNHRHIQDSDISQNNPKKKLKFPFETHCKNQIYLISTLKLFLSPDTNEIFQRISGCWFSRNHNTHVIELLKNEVDITCHMIYEMLSRKSCKIKDSPSKGIKFPRTNY